MKNIILLAGLALIFSCNNEQAEKTLKKAEVETKKEVKKVEKAESDAYGVKKYAVVWKWTTTNEQLVTDNAPSISKELTNLWENGKVENAYYDGNATVDKFEHFPNITFFLKAKSYEAAEVLLNNLTIVKKGIAIYTMYPVGTLWLGRDIKKIKENGYAKSFVAVWVTNKNAKPTDELTKSQADVVMNLWNKGAIENVYFDIEGTQRANNKTDFVFFVNANTVDEAKKVCDNLPFAKEKIATFKILPVGNFWLGQNK